MVANGTEADKRGTDGYGFGLFEEDKVQIKFDQRIITSGNIYHEVYEKTKGKAVEQQWRVSPHDAKWYIFSTIGRAWLLPVDALAQLEIGLRLIQISGTSIGFLFPVERAERFGAEVKDHAL